MGLKNCEEIKEVFKQRYRLFIALMLLLIINLAFFSALLNYLLFVGFQILRSNVVLVSLTISGMTIFSIVALVTAGAIINVFFFKHRLKVTNIGPKKLKTKK